MSPPVFAMDPHGDSGEHRRDLCDERREIARVHDVWP